MTVHVVTSYISHRLGLPPRVAMAAFDSRLPSLRHTVCLTTQGRVRLEVRSHGSATDGAGYSPYRSHVALLISGIRAWPVRLELMPWSADDADLGLRLVRGSKAALPSAAYFAAGSALLEDVAGQITEWTDEALHQALADAGRVSRHGGSQLTDAS